MLRILCPILSNPSRHGWGSKQRRSALSPSGISLSASRCLIAATKRRSRSTISPLAFLSTVCGGSGSFAVAGFLRWSLVTGKDFDQDPDRIRPSRARLKAGMRLAVWVGMTATQMQIVQSWQGRSFSSQWTTATGLVSVTAVEAAMVLLGATAMVESGWIRTGLMGQSESTRGMARLAAANGGELERRRSVWTLIVDCRNTASGTVSVNGATVGQPNLGWVSRSVLWPKSCFRSNSVWVPKPSWVSKQSWVQFLGSGSMWFRIWDPGGWSQLNLVVLAWIIRRNFNFLSNSAYLLCSSFVIVIGLLLISEHWLSNGWC